jgi:hypothetical protein
MILFGGSVGGASAVRGRYIYIIIIYYSTSLRLTSLEGIGRRLRAWVVVRSKGWDVVSILLFRMSLLSGL